MPSIRIFCVLLLFCNAQAQRWEDIPPEDLAASESELDPTAPAEVLYKEIIYDLTTENARIIRNHLRTKIYEKSALDLARRTKFLYSSKFWPSSVRARVIKPDGSAIEATDGDVVTQTEQKSRDITVRSTTITLPQVEVGDIVEYTYRLNLKEDYYLLKDEVSFQEQWPIRTLVLKVKPFVYRAVGFKWASRGTHERMEKNRSGFYEIALENQPAYPDEPYQAPDSDAKAWFTFYNVTSLVTGDRFWLGEGKRLHKEMDSATRSSRIVSEKATELSRGMGSEREKLETFHDFCRSKLINAVHGKADRLTPKQIDDYKDDWNAAKTLSNGYGSPRSINTVFCALARAAGIDARLAHCSDRSVFGFTRSIEQVEVALPDVLVAVKLDDVWVFCNPGARYMPFGQLDWRHDNVTALIPDRQELIFVNTQAAPPEQNIANTRGAFELSPSGELSGKIVLVADGNRGLWLKQLLDGQSESEREGSARNALSQAWPNATLENISIHNADDAFEPIRIECDLTITNYAEVVGTRIFLQPNVDERYAEARFPNSERKTMIFFDFKYRDESYFAITLPEGFALELPSAPASFSVEGLMRYEPKLSMNRSTNALIYRRSLDFVGDRYTAEAYPIIKRAFDMLHAQDRHSITLRTETASAAALGADGQRR